MTTSNPHTGQDNPSTWLHRRIYYLVCCSMFASASLRSILTFQNSPLLDQILPSLAMWLLALLVNLILGGQIRWLAAISIVLEFFLTQVLLLITREDFFAFLFVIPSIQVAQQFTRIGAILLLVGSTLLTFFTLLQSVGFSNAFATAVLYFGGGLFLITYIGSTQRARSIQEEQQKLVSELKQTNTQLVLYSLQVQQLAVVRERQRLARELHDSVTQTIFSMTLATQSALMLLDRDRKQVSTLLDRLVHLTQNALTEMQELISRLAPEKLTVDRFIALLQEQVAERGRLNDLSVQLYVSGSQFLTAMEEQSLFRIIQEALNNVVKHAGVSQAQVRLQLDSHPCLEIEDHGNGFDPGLIRPGSRMGLVNMNERAREIGWTLEVASSPGKGTRIVVRKDLSTNTLILKDEQPGFTVKHRYLTFQNFRDCT